MHRNRDFTSDGRDAQKQRDFTSDGRDAQKQRDFTSGRSTFFGSKLQDGLTNDMECQLQRTQLCLWQDAKTDTVFRMVESTYQNKQRELLGVWRSSAVSAVSSPPPPSPSSPSVSPSSHWHTVLQANHRVSIILSPTSVSLLSLHLLQNVWVHFC